jgi:hypothetical protein
MFGRQLFPAGIARENQSDLVVKLVVEGGMRKPDPHREIKDKANSNIFDYRALCK